LGHALADARSSRFANRDLFCKLAKTAHDNALTTHEHVGSLFTTSKLDSNIPAMYDLDIAEVKKVKFSAALA